MSIALPIAPTGPDTQDFDLVEMLLAEQQSLTAAERFSAFHELEDTSGVNQPAQARYYQDLLPATAPAEGQQYSFQVDLDACSGCKACVVACHTLNGLEEEESWRRVGTLTVGGEQPRVQHVTTACHHCEDPGCLKGCPVKAYDKDPDTGIVRHLDDQCIGCKYCTMMCPYEVPQYSQRLGIVRKCDMCHQRLSAGEAPACVQSCPNGAIKIALVHVGTGRSTAADRLMPDAPLSTITIPTTRYISAHDEGIQDAAAQDAGVDEVAESHWPLALMLVATQVSVGLLIAERLCAAFGMLLGSPFDVDVTRWAVTTAFVIGAAGLNVAPLHLGQPLRAWRVFLGLRTSWLSREAVVLGQYMAILAVVTVTHWVPVFADVLPTVVTDSVPNWAGPALLSLAIVTGVAGLFSSAMIYVATRRVLWRQQRTFARFFGTTAVAGSACLLPALIFGGASPALVITATSLAAVATAAKLGWEWKTHLGPHIDADDPYDHRSRRLVQQKLQWWRRPRVALGLIGAGSLAVLAITATLMPIPLTATLAIGAALAVIGGESCERLLYFKSVVFDRMPATMS